MLTSILNFQKCQTPVQLKEKITLDNGQEVTLLELLNSNGVFWQEDEKNQNKGFPILIKE